MLQGGLDGFGEGGEVAGFDHGFGDEFGAHAYADGAGGKPRGQTFAGGGDASGGHEVGPGARSAHGLDEIRPADLSAGEDLADFDAEEVGPVDLGDGAAAGTVGNLAAVALAGGVFIEQRPDDEVGSGGDIHGGRGGIDHGADAEDDLRPGLVAPRGPFGEDGDGPVAAVGKFEADRPAVSAGGGDLFGRLGVGLIKHRNQSRLLHCR